MCPAPKVLDEVTQRCVYLEDCKWPGFSSLPQISSSSQDVTEQSCPEPWVLEQQGQHRALRRKILRAGRDSSGPLDPFIERNKRGTECGQDQLGVFFKNIF